MAIAGRLLRGLSLDTLWSGFFQPLDESAMKSLAIMFQIKRRPTNMMITGVQKNKRRQVIIGHLGLNQGKVNTLFW